MGMGKNNDNTNKQKANMAPEDASSSRRYVWSTELNTQTSDRVLVM